MHDSDGKKATKVSKKTIQTTVIPRRITKGDISYTHDLYKLKPAAMMRNVSYKKYQPRIEEIEHSHFFHSHSRRGEAQTRCVPVGNHFHEIKTHVDESGNLVAECGPPLQINIIKLKGGHEKKVVEPIIFEDAAQERVFEDKHTHEIQYLYSEEISEAGIRQQHKEDHERFKQMGGVTPTAIKTHQDVKAPEGVEVE